MEKGEKFKNQQQEIPVTGRSVQKYFDELNLTPERIKGKKILDVGAGMAQFARGVKDLGIDADVYSMDPFYSSPEEKALSMGDVEKKEFYQKFSKACDIPEVKNKMIGGIAAQIPFRDEFFDLVIGEWSVPLWMSDIKEVDEFLNETLRVIKDNGNVHIYPIWNVYSGKIREHFNSKLTDMKKRGLINILKNNNDLLIFRKVLQPAEKRK